MSSYHQKLKAQRDRLKRFREESPEEYAVMLLKAKERLAEKNKPYHVDETVYMDYVVGYRRWTLNFSLELLGWNDSIWPLREEMVARGNTLELLDEETFLVHCKDEAGPGLYATKEDQQKILGWGQLWTYGRVALWGRVFEGQLGYKGLIGYPLEILYVSPDINLVAQHNISIGYGIPVLGIKHEEDENDEYWQTIKDYYPLATRNSCTCEKGSTSSEGGTI